ncbi:MAG: hypothetical protein GY913_03130 [Proteobacteria bacterium]|nr:hypothetical protein [Pseudomonadota bacterium]MCP4915893.1 hypothetical protein [Pseudomonadota bacterium]
MPSDGLSYDPTDELYWQPEALAQEIERVFEVCHGCRMCFKFCDSFKDLFKFVDIHDGDVRLVTEDQTQKVMDGCFQCKLCEVECPYTPYDKHDFQLDFPKLVHRHVAQKRIGNPLTFGEQMLADPDRSGALARMSLGSVNTMNKVTFHRMFMERVMGVHRDKLLPDFAAETFTDWAEKNDKITGEGEAVLFQTCFVENNEPHIGEDVVEVMEHNQVALTCEKGLNCCGMPNWEKGDLDGLREKARRNLDTLEPHLDAGRKVLVVNPTCSMMMRREYTELLEGEDRVRAERLAGAVMDCGEFLWSIRKEERFNTDFKSTPGDAVAYHAPCHLRAQRVGFKGRDLIRKIPGCKPKTTMECCGHDGTYAMSTKGFEPSKRIGKKAFDGMNEAESEVWATDCPLAAVQFQQHAGVKPMHPMSVLAAAYRPDGFPTKVEE